MAKILSQAGNSLADIYDVEGSIAGIDHLETHELPIVHEMGSTVFSERLAGGVIRVPTGAIVQSTVIDQSVIGNTARALQRILGIFVSVDTTARIADLAVAIENDADGIPIWVWGGSEDAVRVLVAGTATDLIALIPDPAFTFLPNLMMGTTQPAPTANLTLRGNTSAFGAGDVTATIHLQVAFPVLRGVSSRGLPLPSW